MRINDIAGHNLSVLAPCTLHRLKTLRNGIGNAMYTVLRKLVPSSFRMNLIKIARALLGGV